jgi:hypothetical protein
MSASKKNPIDNYRDAVEPYLYKPAKWAKDVCRYDLDQWQIEYLEHMIDGKFSVVAGCNGSGKDFISSLFALFLLSTRPMLKGQVTGPNREQIFDVVWAECHKIISHSHMLSTVLLWEKTHIRNRLAPEEWFIVAKTASKRFSAGGGDAQAEGVQGIRGLYTLVLMTEASGIEDANFEAAQSCCATQNAYLGAVGNPLRRSGFFYNLFHNDAFDGWFRRHVSYTESSYTDKKQMEKWMKEYGLDSSFVTARCFGQFPLSGAEDTAIPWALVKAAMDRETPLSWGSGLQLGVDPARLGNDEAVIAVRNGYVIEPLKVYKTSTSGQLVNGIVDAVHEYGGNYDTPIMVDEAGLGGMGVVDPLRERGYKEVYGCQNNAVPERKDRYRSWDDEQWMEIMPEIFLDAKLPADDVLLTQLTTRRWKFTGRNNKQRRLENKEELKRRGYSSPDRAEAVMLACAPLGSLDMWGGLDHEKRDSLEETLKRDGMYFSQDYAPEGMFG